MRCVPSATTPDHLSPYDRSTRATPRDDGPGAAARTAGGRGRAPPPGGGARDGRAGRRGVALPARLSGGQRQARGDRASDDRDHVVIADEPFHARRRSVPGSRAHGRTRELGVSFLFITHDLMSLGMSTRIVVMYLGKIVETGETEAVIGRPPTRTRAPAVLIRSERRTGAAVRSFHDRSTVRLPLPPAPTRGGHRGASPRLEVTTAGWRLPFRGVGQRRLTRLGTPNTALAPEPC